MTSEDKEAIRQIFREEIKSLLNILPEPEGTVSVEEQAKIKQLVRNELRGRRK